MNLIQNLRRPFKKRKIKISYFLNSTFLFTNRNSQHYNTIIEDENEEGVWEENAKEVNPSKPFLMSINFSNISLYRFPTLE